MSDPLDRVRAAAPAWAALPGSERASLLRGCAQGVVEVAAAWTERGSRAVGIDPASPAAGEMGITGPTITARTLRLLAETAACAGLPRTGSVRPAPGGRAAVRVFPRGALDRAMYPGIAADVWLGPGRRPARRPPGPGGTALVLGAGNITSIAPLDVAHQLVFENRTVVLKLSPLHGWLAPLLEWALAPLVERDFVAVVQADLARTRAMAADPRIDALHLTGAARTYDALVWGEDGTEAARRRAEGRPLLSKPFTAELGCVTPVFVVPGRWSGSDLAFQARNVASMLVHNAGHNCTAAQVLVTAEGWPQRRAFLQELRQAMAAAPARPAWYPGSAARAAEALAPYPGAEPVGRSVPGGIPWTLVPGVPPRAGEPALTHEAFCGVLFETALPAVDAPGFLRAAVDLSEQALRGTLSAALLVDGATARRERPALQEALAGLRYGVVAVNAYPGLAFALGEIPWGASPGNPPEAIGSGCGFVHNALGLDGVEKTILRARFRLFPTPVWFAGHRTLDRVARLAVPMEAAPSWGRLPALALAALRG